MRRASSITSVAGWAAVALGLAFCALGTVGAALPSPFVHFARALNGLALALCGGVLLVHRDARVGPLLRRITGAATAIVVGIALANLRERPLMLGVSFCLVALACGLAALRFSGPRIWTKVRVIAALGVTGLGTFGLIAFIYRAQPLIHLGLPYLSVKPGGAIFLIVMGLGLLCARDDGPVATLRGRGPGGAMMRTIIPSIAAVTVFFGWLRVNGERLGAFDPASGSATLVFTLLLVLVAVVWTVARKVDAEDAEKIAALATANDAVREFRQLAEMIPQFVYRTDRDGRGDYVNRNWVDYTGLDESAQLDTGWIATIHPDDRKRYSDEWRRAVASDEIFESECRMRGRDGTYRWFLTRSVAVKDEAGKAIRWVGTSTDIEERKAGEREARFLAELGRVLGDALSIEEIVAAMSRDFVPEIADTSDVELTGESARSAKTSMENALSVPIRARGTTLGAFTLARRGPLPFAERDRRFAEEIASRVGVAIDNARLYRELSDKNRLLDAVIESMPNGLAVADRMGSILLVNRAARDLLKRDIEGISSDELLSAFELRRPDGSPLPPREMALAEALHGRRVDDAHILIGGESIGPEPRHLSISSRPLVDDVGKVKGAVAVFTDVTDRKRLEEHSERSLALLEATPDIVGVCDSQERVIYLNRTGRASLGIDLPLETYHIRDFHAPHVYEKLQREAMPIAIRDGCWTGETEFLRKDGTTIPTSQVLVAHYDDDSRATYFSTVCRDISYVKEAERALRRSNEDLQQFASIISHDLQEPLRTITSYIALATRNLPADGAPRVKEFMGFVVDGAERMKRLLASMIEFSRVSSKGQELQPVDADLALNEALDNLRSTIRARGATIAFEPLPRVKADIAQLGQLFQNLVGNAIKYCERKPVVAITAQPEGERFVRFAVRDNGIGIEMRYAERVFQIFQRLHSRAEYEGMGVGLSVCKRIVERHGGRIWLESTLGEGTTFYFTLPGAE